MHCIVQASILGDIALKLSEGVKLTILQTQKDGPSPQELAQQALKEGADLVLVSGGDGTVGAVAGALVDTGEGSKHSSTGQLAGMLAVVRHGSMHILTK